MAVPALVGDALPLGRHPATLPEVETAYVCAPIFVASLSRQAIWQHFETATDLLRSVVTVHSAWIGGSFTTSKINPRDIDVVYWISGEDRARRSVGDRRVVETFVNRVGDPLTGRQMPEHGLLVDSFVVSWHPHLPPREGNPHYERYTADRGYWDDWWARQRSGAKKAPPTRSDAIPRRGFLEVQFSAYA